MHLLALGVTPSASGGGAVCDEAGDDYQCGAGNDSANAAKLDTYLILLGGHGADGKVLARDDDGGPGADSRISRKLPAGDYTIEATSWASRRVGRYLLNVNARHDNKVGPSRFCGMTVG